jgi:3-hydroxyacyl-[acyl-carrier-protein] dehydratase
MPLPTPILDLESVDLSGCVSDRADIAKYNPHRGVFALLDRVIWHSDDLHKAVAIMHVREDQFWVPGHIPGNPLLPGVLMVEASAQLASYLYYKRFEQDVFAGFTRIEDTIFRSRVVPGQDLYILASIQKAHIKRFVSDVQGVVDGEIVFQSRITGMSFPEMGKLELAPPDAVSDLPNPAT